MSLPTETETRTHTERNLISITPHPIPVTQRTPQQNATPPPRSSAFVPYHSVHTIN
ncbi:hypothetical protein EX30DRAFT_341574 [Ascodesmis nigricans]|uniref:Uncharacterized protein n=1 Tax=Ascodesmis nigricans TaxID=341454 RepID=A0A4S2MUR8_9PEZI|nr:hypothetical protein EX30DRAFT_341574 [Ascodesmis nigricans]